MNDVLITAFHSLGKTDALDLRARAKSMDGTAIIDEEYKIPQFVNKDYSKWPAGSPVVDEGQVWTLLQPYDATIHTEHPEDARDRWSLCHTKNPLKAKPWLNSLGTSGMYMKDECYRVGNTVYRAKQDNLIFNARDLPDAWEAVK